MDNRGLKLPGNYKHPKDLKNPKLKLQVFSYNNDAGTDQKICSALSSMSIGQPTFTQFHALVEFKSAGSVVLTTRGQPFGYSSNTNEFWSYRIECLDRNSYANHKTKVSIGLPGRVFLKRSPEWTQDVSSCNDSMHSNIRGVLAMPVIDGDRCIGVLEFAMMTNLKDNCFHEMMSEACRALEDVGLKSLVPNENINVRDISKDYSSLAESSRTAIGSRNSKSCNFTCNDITKLFGMPKEDAAKMCGISLNTFTKVHRMFGINEWPHVRKGVAKSSAHNALELGRAYHITNPVEIQQIKHINDLLMQDDDDINYEDVLVEEQINYLLSNDGKRVREEHGESPNPVLLELYHH